MIFADRKYVFAYAMRLSPCAGCGGKFIGRDLYTVTGWQESLTFFEGYRLCRALGSRVTAIHSIAQKKSPRKPISSRSHPLFVRTGARRGFESYRHMSQQL